MQQDRNDKNVKRTAGGLAVELLDPPVDGDDGEDGEEEPGQDAADHEERAQRGEQAQEEVRHHVRDLLVHHALVLREPRHDTASGRGVEE